MISALLLALSFARAASAQAAWNVSFSSVAVLGQETIINFRPAPGTDAGLAADPLASATTSFAVVSALKLSDNSWQWTVLPLDEGKLRFSAHWTLNGQTQETPPVSLQVSAPQVPKDADISDIKGPARAKRAWWPWLLAAILGACAWELWRRYGQRDPEEIPEEPAEPPLTPEQTAERALIELEASELWGNGEFDLYYLRLTNILREYLEARYEKPATAMTTPQLALFLRGETNLDTSRLVREMLQRADLAKFARTRPEADEGPRDLSLVRKIVLETTPVENDAPAAAEKPA